MNPMISVDSMQIIHLFFLLDSDSESLLDSGSEDYTPPSSGSESESENEERSPLKSPEQRVESLKGYVAQLQEIHSSQGSQEDTEGRYSFPNHVVTVMEIGYNACRKSYKVIFYKY